MSFTFSSGKGYGVHKPKASMDTENGENVEDHENGSLAHHTLNHADF
ncbi:hypothetical protein C5167_024640 [Papaver somniferum]|uniref:Uncharacterized protein n=1 Tax=Papaver somniferum TaxID=3469 RepID=A0A4Y7JQ90_PAPSO|nr:hypothetical protein C5167_024640 [Papaver somniferum]